MNDTEHFVGNTNSNTGSPHLILSKTMLFCLKTNEY